METRLLPNQAERRNMMTETNMLFVERVKKELGESINPFYVESLLKKNVPELMFWIHNHFNDLRPPILETLSYAEQYQNDNSQSKNILSFGIDILLGNLRLAIFVLKEVQSRLEATETKTI